MTNIIYIFTLPVTTKSFFLNELIFLANKDFKVTVITGHDSDLERLLDSNGIQYISIDIPRGISISGSVRSILELIKLFKQNKCDIVQYCTPNASLYSSIASKIAKIKVRNYHMMGIRYLSEKGILKRILKKLEKITCSLSTDIEVVSKSNLKLAESEGLFPIGKGQVIWNGSSGGVDLGKFDIMQKEKWRTDVRESIGISENSILYGYIGRINKDKGIEELLLAYQKLESSSVEEIALLIVGNKENIEELERGIWDYAIRNPKIILLESKDDIEKYFASMDVFVFPSHREGLGNVVVEAAAMGIPVISYRIPGPIDAMIENVTGLLVEPENYLELYEKMKMMLDSNLRLKLSSSSREFVETHFDSKELLEHILKRKHDLLGIID